MDRTSSPCAACKFLRRKCSSDCIFAPYFPLDQTQKFINLHKVYGTSNVQNLLAKLPVDRRQEAVNSLAYEAEARIQDPVYGCIGPIVLLQHRFKNMTGELQDAYKELATYQDAVLQTQQAMGVADFPTAQPTPDIMHTLGVNPLLASSSSEPQNLASMMGIPTMDSSLKIHESGSQSNNNINTFHPQQLVMPTATVGMEQQQENIRAFQLRQHGQDFTFDRGRGINVGAGSSTRVGVVRFSQNNPPQQTNNNNTLHPEQLVLPIATVGTEQRETIRAFELQQQGQENRFDWVRGFNVGTGSSSGVGVAGFSLNDLGPQSNNNSNTLHPEQLVMPIDTVGTKQQEITRAFELQQQGQDNRFNWGQGFDVRTGNSSGVGVVGLSLNEPGLQSNNNNNTLHPEQNVMPIATVGSEQHKTIRTFGLQQHRQDVRFDGGQRFDVGTWRSSGVGEVGFSLNNPGPQSNDNNTLHPEKLVMPTATIGTEQLQEIISAFEEQQHGQGIVFDWGQGLDVGTGSSNEVGVKGFSLIDPGEKSNNYNSNTLHPEQHVVPIATVGTEQQENIRAFDLQQQGQDNRFDGGRGFNVGAGSSTGVGVVGFGLNDPGSQSDNNSNTSHPEQLVMHIDTVGTKQQEFIRAFELQQQGQDNRFDWGEGFDVRTGISSEVGVVGLSLNDPGQQSNNNNNTLHPEQLVMPTATIGTEQQETIRDFELQQHRQDVWFDGGQGFDVGIWSSSGSGEVGFSLNDPGPQSHNNNNTLHPEQHAMPTATIGTEQQQEIICDFELQQQGQDVRFDGGQGFDVGSWSSRGVREVGFRLNDPGPQSNDNNKTLHPERHVMPTATIGTGQLQEIISDFELPQQGNDVQFDGCQGFDIGTWSTSGVGEVGFSLNDPGPQSNNNDSTFHPEQPFMTTSTIGTEHLQEIVSDFELQEHGQDIGFDWGHGLDVGNGSSSGVGVVGFSLNDPGPQSNNNNSTLHLEQHVLPISAVGTEQQQTIRAFECQQQGQDNRFDWGEGFDVGTGISSGVGDGVVGFSLNYPGPQSNNNNNTLHPKQLVMPTATIGTVQLEEIISDFELEQQGQDVRFNGGQGFDIGSWSSCGVLGEVGFNLNNPSPQSSNNNSIFHPEQHFMPTATGGTEQLQQILSTFELRQQGQDIAFDWGQGLDVGTVSCSGAGVVGFSLNDPGPQSNDNNTLHPEQLIMPIATVGSEQEETFRAFELQQHGEDIRFDGGQDFNVGAGSSTGVGGVGFSPNNPPSALQVSPHPMFGSSESEFSHPHFQPQLSSRPKHVVAGQEHHMQGLESQEEWLQELNVGNCEAETGSSFYYVNR